MAYREGSRVGIAEVVNSDNHSDRTTTTLTGP